MIKTVKSKEALWFFVLALGISWFFWMWIIIFNWDVWSFPAVIFGGLGLFGPTIAELSIIYYKKDKNLWQDYWKRVFDIKRIGKKWHIVIWLTFPTINGIALLLSIYTGSSVPNFETAKNLFSQPWKIIPYILFILFFGPVPEELGWRGYGLDSLQRKFSALLSSFILGTVWVLWHIPLFFMKGTFQHDKLKFGTIDFWSYIVGPIIISVLFTWIYNNTNRSTMSAIFFHFMTNFSGELIPLTQQGRIYSTVFLTIMTVGVVVFWGPETLTKKKDKGKKMNKISKKKGIIRRFFGKGVCPYQLSFILDSTLRKLILSPEKLADRLHLKEDSKVLELGCGSGYFSVEVAKRLPKGHLELLDLQKEMLEKARRKIEAKGLKNVGYTQGDAINLPFADNEFDVVFLVAVLGEVTEPEKCLKEIYRVLKPEGLLSITEQPGDPDFVALEKVKELAEKQGFEFIEKFGKKRNFTANFKKKK